MAVIVVDGVVLRASVVPERDRPRTPAEPAAELRPRLVTEEIIEQRRAFFLRHPVEPDGVGDVDVQRAPAGLGMPADHRMRGEVVLPDLASAVLHAILARPTRV